MLAEREQQPPPHFLTARSLACRFVIITAAATRRRDAPFITVAAARAKST